MFTSNSLALNQVYNTACSERITLNQVIEKLADITKHRIEIKYGEERVGDVKHSFASIKKAESLLGYSPLVNFDEGLKKVVSWYRQNLSETEM